jgi:hypothetical protein
MHHEYGKGSCGVLQTRSLVADIAFEVLRIGRVSVVTRRGIVGSGYLPEGA